jgi:hypothetical protein
VRKFQAIDDTSYNKVIKLNKFFYLLFYDVLVPKLERKNDLI